MSKAFVWASRNPTPLSFNSQPMPRCEAEDYALNLVRTGHRHVKVYRAAQTPSFVTDDLLLELVAK